MKNLSLYTSLVLGLALMTSCGPSRYTTSTEADDAYFVKADEVKPELPAADATVAAEEGRNSSSTTTAPSQAPAQGEYYDSYDGYQANGSSRYNEAQYNEYDNNYQGYADDDYYYSRQMRRFNNNAGWNYYDPYNSYDIYYTMGTPTWGNVYAGSPWWYDPMFYSGPAYTWTYGWGYSGGYWGYGWNSYNGWNNGWNRGWNNGWGGGWSYYPGFGWDYNMGWNSWGWNNGFNNGFNNGYCYGYNAGVNSYYNSFANSNSNTVAGPRTSLNSINPGVRPAVNGRASQKGQAGLTGNRPYRNDVKSTTYSGAGNRTLKTTDETRQGISEYRNSQKGYRSVTEGNGTRSSGYNNNNVMNSDSRNSGYRNGNTTTRSSSYQNRNTNAGTRSNTYQNRNSNSGTRSNPSYNSQPRNNNYSAPSRSSGGSNTRSSSPSRSSGGSKTSSPSRSSGGSKSGGSGRGGRR